MGLNKVFPYLPLTTPTQTRIISLAPGTGDDPIHCSQFIIDLDKDETLFDAPDKVQHLSHGQPCSSLDTSLPEENPAPVIATPGLQKQSVSACSSSHAFQRYAALSYVWGDQSNPQKIFMDQKPFYVGANLYKALLGLRKRATALEFSGATSRHSYDRKFDNIKHHLLSKNCMLWVDAICINQNDAAEREAHVKLMARIYQQADYVHGDLGQDSMSGGRNLVHLLQTVLRAGQRCKAQTPASEITSQPKVGSESHDDITSALVTEYENWNGGKSGHIRQVNVPSPTVQVLEEQGIPKEDDDLWLHWRKLLDSPYFQRLWIVQEASLAKSITLWYSDVSIGLEIVGMCFDYLIKYSKNPIYYSVPLDEYDSAKGTSPNVWAVLGLLRQRRQMHDDNDHLVKQVSLLDLLGLARRTKATDLRDKIFGLLGMAADGSDFLHLVSYSRSAAAVYQDFAQFFVERGQGIKMLCQVDSIVSRTLEIPSWVPDWSRDSDEVSLYDEARATSSAHDMQKSVDMRSFGSNLLIKGQIVDTVKYLGKYLVSSSVDYTTFSEVVALLWEGGNILTNQDVDVKNPVEVILQTLTCGSLRERSPSEVKSLHEGFTAVFGHGTYLINGGKFEDSPWLPHMRHFMVRGMALTPGRRWCITESGRFGLVPGGAEKGDCVALFGDHSIPFFIRPTPDQSSASGQPMDRINHQSFSTRSSSSLDDVNAGCLPKVSNTNAGYILIGHGYINELDAVKIQEDRNRDAQEIMLV